MVPATLFSISISRSSFSGGSNPSAFCRYNYRFYKNIDIICYFLSPLNIFLLYSYPYLPMFDNLMIHSSSLSWRIYQILRLFSLKLRKIMVLIADSFEKWWLWYRIFIIVSYYSCPVKLLKRKKEGADSTMDSAQIVIFVFTTKQ